MLRGVSNSMPVDALSHVVARRFSCRRVAVEIIVAIAISGFGCGGSSPAAPTTTTTTTGAQSFSVTCFATLLVGQTLDCTAVGFPNGVLTNVNTGATFTSSDPTIASFGLFGLLTGHAAGQVTVTASYGGQSASSAPVSVQFIDVVQVNAALGPDATIAGSAMFTGLIGFYGVASADSGQLSLVITDQNNSVIGTSNQTVARGGNTFAINTTITIPLGTTQVCRKMVLQIGTSTLVAIPSAGLVPCSAVMGG